MGICNSLDGEGADFRTFDPADVMEMSWAVMEVFLNDDPKDPPEKLFCDEIRSYIGVEADREGFAELPRPITFGLMEGKYGEASDVFAGDQVMFSAYFSGAKDEVKRVEAATAAKLQRMVQQISRLPLQSGDAESWQKFAGRGLRLIGKQ